MKKFYCTVIFLLLANVLVFSQNIDINILKTIHVHRNQSLDEGMKTITDSYIPVSVGVPGIMMATGLLSDNKKLTYDALEIYAGIVAGWLLTESAKRIVDRKRPSETYSFIQPYKNLHGHSFPSGHTSTAFSFATSISLEYKKWYVVVPAYTWASLVAYSRMHLGVHYPSDVLGGIIIGAGTAYLCHYFRNKLEKNYNNHHSTAPLN